MKRKDLSAAAILLLVAGGYYLATVRIPSSTLDDGVGPRGFPLALTAALVVFALALAVRALVAVPATRGAPATQDVEAPWPRALGLLALGALYVPAAIVVGYPLALVLLLIAVPLYEGRRFSWRTVAIAVGGAAFFYVLFELVLGVRQPEGLLF